MFQVLTAPKDPDQSQSRAFLIKVVLLSMAVKILLDAAVNDAITGQSAWIWPNLSRGSAADKASRRDKGDCCNHFLHDLTPASLHTDALQLVMNG